MFKKIALAAALMAGFGTANAYVYEVNAGYEKTDMDYSAEVDTYSVNGKFYLNDVTAKGPLAEAGFLGQASNIGLGYSKSTLEETGAELELQSYGVRGEFFIPDTKFYVAGSLNQAELTLDIEGDGAYKADTTGYSLEVGYLPINGLLLAAGVTKENLDSANVGKTGFADSYATLGASGEDTAATLRAKYVTEIGNHWTNFEGSTVLGDETAYRIAADLYLDPTLSLGVSFADSTVEDFDGIYSVNAQKFFGEKVAVGLNYSTTDGADAFGINGTFRF